jgi:Na+-transporting methylmalonyl-CoA/oxaloacetate decarboxylase gamma subunit
MARSKAMGLGAMFLLLVLIIVFLSMMGGSRCSMSGFEDMPAKSASMKPVKKPIGG